MGILCHKYFNCITVMHGGCNRVHYFTREEDALISIFIIEMTFVMLHSLKLAHKDDASLGIGSSKNSN